MKFLRNKNAPPLAGLVQEFIDTAYDTVKLVADNLDLITAVGNAIEAGTLDEFISAADIDTLAKLNAFVLDANIASEAYVDAAVVGLYDFKGGYDANTNTPDLTTSPNSILVADSYQVTVAGTFFGVNVEPGDQLTAIIDSPTVEADWSIVNRNIDSAAFATAAQGATADTALQPTDGAAIKSAYEGEANTNAYTDAEKTKLGGVEALAKDDQTGPEIESLYNGQVPQISGAEKTAGTETAIRRFAPKDVADMAAGWNTVTNGIGTTFNFTATNLKDLVVAENVAASAYSVPDALGVAGNSLSLFNKGAGAVTIDVPGTDVLISTENVCEQRQAITILKVSPTEWAVIGGTA